jgi:hypothetical protein
VLLTDAKKTATLILGSMGDRATEMRERSKDNLEAASSGLEVHTAEELAALQLIEAVHSKNPGAVAKSFRAFWALCEATEYED